MATRARQELLAAVRSRSNGCYDRVVCRRCCVLLGRALIGCVLLGVIALGALRAAGEPGARLPDGAFVRVERGAFVVGATPLRFVGANLNVMHGSRERARFRDTLRAAAADGLTVGRIWAFSEGTVDAGEWYRHDNLFRAGPDDFIEESFVHLDRVLAAAREDGLRLIITLSNNWTDYGGAPMYLRWAGLPVDDPDGRFYSDARTRAYFRAHLDRLLARVNTITGARYVDDPTIFAWELMNESEVATPTARAARRAWIVEMARHIKALDPHHLVAPGLLGYATRADRAEWVRVHQLDEVDYCDSHLYPQTTARVRSWTRLAELIDDRAQLARFVVKKPLVFGEFGFRTDGSRDHAWRGHTRADWVRRFVERVLGDGGAGALAWIYQPYLDHPRDYGIYVDRRDTEDVRGALRGVAARVRSAVAATFIGSPLLGEARGNAPLYDPLVTVAGHRAPAARWRDGRLAIDPTAFAVARFEQAGTWTRGVLVHAYGAGSGRFVYRFRAPPRRARALRITARLSSEWPGTSGPPDGASPVRVLLDGREVAMLTVATDDGVGRAETIDVPAVSPRAVHTLVFEVPDVADAHGLCVYGDATGHGAPPGDGLVGPITITALR